MSDKIKALIISLIVLFAGAAIFGYGTNYGRRRSDVEWQTAITTRHLGYWIIRPGREPYIEFRNVIKWRDSCVIYRDKNGKEISK